MQRRYLLNDGNCCLSDVTDEEALQICTEELKAIPASAIAVMVASGFKDISPLTNALRNSVRRICIKGAGGEVTNFVKKNWLWLLGGSAAVYFIVKEMK